MNGICKLCGKEKKLCKQSHIIPNFMYKDLFDEKNRMNAIQSEKDELKQAGHCQTGEFDRHILCENCDNSILGRLDRYASLILYDGYPKISENRTDSDGTRYTYCAELDYTQFKLFLLSVLWRASVSNRTLFKEVSLGPHEEYIRRMILDSNPGDQLEYPCLIMTYLSLTNFPHDVVLQPSLSRVNGGYVYKFLIGGMVYIFYVSSHIIHDQLKEYSINRNGELRIVQLLPQGAKKVFNNMLGVKLK